MSCFYLVFCFVFFFLRNSLSLGLKSPKRALLINQQAMDSTCPHIPTECWDSERALPCPVFGGVWGSNSRPHRCMASTSQIDLRLQSTYRNADKHHVYVICVIRFRLYMFLNLLVKALMSWISNSHLQFNLVVLRG